MNMFGTWNRTAVSMVSIALLVVMSFVICSCGVRPVDQKKSDGLGTGYVIIVNQLLIGTADVRSIVKRFGEKGHQSSTSWLPAGNNYCELNNEEGRRVDEIIRKMVARFRGQGSNSYNNYTNCRSIISGQTVFRILLLDETGGTVVQATVYAPGTHLIKGDPMGEWWSVLVSELKESLTGISWESGGI